MIIFCYVLRSSLIRTRVTSCLSAFSRSNACKGFHFSITHPTVDFVLLQGLANSMETNDFHSASERRLRLKPLPLSDLPSHPLLTSHQSTTSPSLQPFILEVLAEAISFSDSIVPTQFKSKGSPKSSEPSTAKVQLLTCDDIVQAGVKGEKTEPWFARHSVHEDAPKHGTTTFEEMVHGLMRDHSKNEMEYTPDVYDAYKVLDWTEEIARLQSERGLQGYREMAMEGWSQVLLQMSSSTHTLHSLRDVPSHPLSSRQSHFFRPRGSSSRLHRLIHRRSNTN
jgi:hypothetical protein